MAEIDRILESGTECPNMMFEQHIAELITLMNGTSYPGKEVFLKELISFSSTRLEIREGERMGDGCDHSGGEELSISVSLDKEKNCLIVEDNGIEVTEDNLGMRPKQGTKALISALKAGKNLNSINLFDVGFFTLFAVADKVTICSTHSGRTELYTWESCAMERGFSVKYTENDQYEPRTQFTLELKMDIAECIKRTGMEEFLRKHNCRSSYDIKVHQYSVINGSEEDWAEPKKEAAVVNKGLWNGSQSTPGTSQGRKKSSKLGRKSKKSRSTISSAVSGPSPKKLSSTPMSAPTQSFHAPGTSTPSEAGQMPPGMVSPANPEPTKAGVSPDPPAGPSFSTPSSVPAQKFNAHGTGQMVSPTMQNPSGARVPSVSGSVKIKSPDNQSKGTKRKSKNPHETPKSRKSSVSPDSSAIPAVVTAHRQNELGKGANTPFRDFTNLESIALKTPGCAKTPGGTSRTSTPSSRNSPLVPNENSISTLASVKNQIGGNFKIAAKVIKQIDPGKEKSEAGGKTWYRGSYEIADSTDRATLKVYGDQDMRYFQPRQCLLLHVWIRDGHVALTKLGKVDKYTGEIKTVDDIVKKRRLDEAQKRKTLHDIRNLPDGCIAAARVHVKSVGDIQTFKNKHGSETVLRKLEVKDQKNSVDIYELVTFYDIAKAPFQVDKRYLFDSITYCHDKGNFKTVGRTLPKIVPLRRENERVCQQLWE